jgi:hypothetical protein
MSCYFVPRPSFKWPRVAFRSSSKKVRREAIFHSIAWFSVLLCVSALSVYGITLTPDSKWVQAGFGAILGSLAVLYTWFLLSTWLDDGRHDKKEH